MNGLNFCHAIFVNIISITHHIHIVHLVLKLVSSGLRNIWLRSVWKFLIYRLCDLLGLPFRNLAVDGCLGFVDLRLDPGFFFWS